MAWDLGSSHFKILLCKLKIKSKETKGIPFSLINIDQHSLEPVPRDPSIGHKTNCLWPRENLEIPDWTHRTIDIRLVRADVQGSIPLRGDILEVERKF